MIFRERNRRRDRWRIEGDTIGQLYSMRSAATVSADGDSTLVDESSKGGARVFGDLTTEPAIEPISHIFRLDLEFTSFGSSGAGRPLSRRHYQWLVRVAPGPQRPRPAHPELRGPKPAAPARRW